MNIVEELSSALKSKRAVLYPDSVREIGKGKYIFAARSRFGKAFGIVGDAKGLDGAFLPEPLVIADGKKVNLYPLTWENYGKLQKILPIAPVKCDKPISFGTGDRLGMVTAAHLSVMKKYPVFPVVAQQSARELQKTGRNFKGVLLDAVWGVLESGYKEGFGADADHIKDEAYLREGVDAGYSMYTLDASDWLPKTAMTDAKVQAAAKKLSKTSLQIIKDSAGRKVSLPGSKSYTIDEKEMVKSAVIFEKAMDWVKGSRDIIREKIKDFDLEVSIDESDRTTTPEDHLFVVEYLRKIGVDFSSLAPKFPGEFQKAVDYRGDMKELEKSFQVHSALAKELGGYRLSLHSGSDKFSVYKMFAKTSGSCHVKTSGTSWLEALEVVIQFDPGLFSYLYFLCLDNLDESKKAYHVSITQKDFPDCLPTDLMAFYDKPEVRQLFHISYGVLLEEEGREILWRLREHEEEHYKAVVEHIDRHVSLLFAK